VEGLGGRRSYGPIRGLYRLVQGPGGDLGGDLKGDLGRWLTGKRRKPGGELGFYGPIRRLYKRTRGVYGPARE
jgi:hypothetical protein